MGGRRLTSSIGYSDYGRMYFFDYLRTFIVLLVIVFHVAIGYMAKAPQWWYVVDTQKNGIFDLFVMNTDVFIMPAMFFIAGYFALPVLHKKGIGIFMREKFFRIVVPWLVGVLLFAPAITYMIWYSRTDSPPAYSDYLVKHFFTAATFNHAHYWFLGVLAWFFLLLACFYRFKPAAFQRNSAASTPSFRFFIQFGVVTALAFFVPNLFFHADAWFSKWVLISFQPTRLLLCGAYFALGIYAWQNLWFTGNGYQPRVNHWSWSILLMLIFFNSYRLSYSETATVVLKAGHAFVHVFFCLAAVFWLLAVFQTYFDRKGTVLQPFSSHSYSIYYVHQLVVLPIAYLVQKLAISVWVKYFAVSFLAIIICLLVAGLIDRLIGAFNLNSKVIADKKL